MDEHKPELRVRPAGLYAYDQPQAPQRLHWSTCSHGLMHYGSAGGSVLVVVDGALGPKRMHSIRWVAPKQGPQPFMFRRRLEDAIALAERVLRIKGRIA